MKEPTRTPTAEPSPSPITPPGLPISGQLPDAKTVGLAAAVTAVVLSVGSILSKGPACVLGGAC
jgi:hypothetical protein